MTTFSKASAPFAQRGLFPASDLLPIIPPGAAVNQRSAIDSSQIGKVPGRYDPKRNEWWGLTGAWPTSGVSPSFVARASAWPTENVGLRAENWPAVDIDVSSEEARDLAEALAVYHLGNAPARVRDGAPRALLVYRKVGDEPIRKSRLVFQDDKGTEHAVEVLALGQQYLIAGTHPTGAKYEWREGADLAAWTANGLSKISAQDVRSFFDALSAEITAKGWKIVRDVRLKSSAGAGVQVKDLEPVVSTETALAALRSIPNNEETLPMREDIVGVLAAFRAAVGRESLDPKIEQACREWATETDWADDAYFDQVWRSLTTVKVGPERLFGVAHKFGFIGDAQEDFRDPDNTDAQIAAAQTAQDEEKAKLEAVAKRLLYWPEKELWIVKETGELLSNSALNAYPGLGTEISPSGTSGTKSAANRLINAGITTVVKGITYMPSRERVFTWQAENINDLFYNRWRDYAVELPLHVTNADIQPWLDHISYLFENKEDSDYLLDFIAHIVQKRGVKVRWAPLIIGNQGVGKDLFLRPLLNYLKHNATMVEPQMLTNRFVDFYEKEFVVVEEMVRFEKNEAYERLKVALSGNGSGTLKVERKYKDSYEVPNIVNFLFFSNHSDAINLDRDDRRFFVIHSYANPRSGDYYTALADNFYEAEGGWKKVIAWLKQRDISAFNPNHRPKMTDDKLNMIEESQPYPYLWLQEQLTSGMWRHRSVMSIQEIMHACSIDFSIPEVVRSSFSKYQGNVRNALKFCEWQLRPQQIRVGKQVVRLWCKTPELVSSSAEMLKARYEAEIEKKLANVG